jgi:hypothetical protein
MSREKKQGALTLAPPARAGDNKRTLLFFANRKLQILWLSMDDIHQTILVPHSGQNFAPLVSAPQFGQKPALGAASNAAPQFGQNFAP